MIRHRTFICLNWGPQTYSRDFVLKDYTGISGSQAADAYSENIENIGNSNSTDCAIFHFAEGPKAKSTFSFKFIVEQMNVPPNAIVDNVALTIKYRFVGNLGNGGSGRFAWKHATQSGYTYTQPSKTLRVTTISYNASVKKFESLKALEFWFETTCGSEGYDNPRIEFYGASLKIDWHINDIPIE